MAQTVKIRSKTVLTWKSVRTKSEMAMNCESGRCHSGSDQASYRLQQGPGLPSLRKDLQNQQATIRFYYINSVRWIDDENHRAGLYQSGCGIHLKSKYATLCTCKLKMLERLHKDRRQLEENPVYIAALGVTKGRQPNSKITPLSFSEKWKGHLSLSPIFGSTCLKGPAMQKM